MTGEGALYTRWTEDIQQAFNDLVKVEGKTSRAAVRLDMSERNLLNLRRGRGSRGNGSRKPWSGRRKSISMGVLDRLATALERPELLHGREWFRTPKLRSEPGGAG